MKEYAFLPGNMLDLLRPEFMPIRPAKRFLSCIDGAKKEQAESDIVEDVSVISAYNSDFYNTCVQTALFSIFVLRVIASTY